MTQSRRGGKPKGYKHTGFRLVIEGQEARAAESAFLHALNDVLPVAAFNDLLEVKRENVPAWADKWRIRAPCVIQAATDIVRSAPRWNARERAVRLYKKCLCPTPSRCKHPYWYRSSILGRDHVASTHTANRERAERLAVDAHRTALATSADSPNNWRSPLQKFADSYAGPRIPLVWRVRVSTLNRWPVEERLLDNVLDSDVEPIASKPDPSITDEKTRQNIQRTIRVAHARALRRPRVSAPLGGDPLRESCDEFVIRARNHWHARAERAKRVLHKAKLKVRPFSAKHELAVHSNWLARHVVKGKSFAEIGNASGEARSPEAVEFAVRSLARLVKLRLPRGRQGRPPRKP